MLPKLELAEGVGVFTSDDKQVGQINRFVLDPETNEVTHIVVQKGWLLTEDKVVPLRMVSSATDEKVTLNRNSEDFDNLLPFEESHFIRAADNDFHPAFYWYPPTGYVGDPGYGFEYYLWPPVEKTRNIPEDTVPLREGARVISSDEKHVGNIERLIIEGGTNSATHLLITEGLLHKEQKLIPARWIKFVEEDKVHLTVSSTMLKRLPVYIE